MVSYPDSADQSLAVRRPSSIVSASRAPATRRHRSHRSHFGGSSYAPQNEFPVFTHTGDVEIVLKSQDGKQEKRYLLHRIYLTQCSGFFEASTSQEWSRIADTSAQGSSSQGGTVVRTGAGELGEKKRWRYELDWGNGNEGASELPILIQKDPNQALFSNDRPALPPPVRNKPPPSSAGFFRTMANFSTLNVQQQAAQDPVDDLLQDYDNLFRIFYNYPPALDSVNIAVAYVQCKTLLQLADMYDALDVIGPRVDHHLLRFQGRLFKQIAKYPPSYLKLGYLARSKVIFSEALVHVVGQWPAGTNQLRGQTPDTVMELIEDKVDELDEIKTKVEVKLFRLTLTTHRGERVTPANDLLGWQAMSLFRQWLAENTTPPPTPILKDSTRNTHSRNGSSNQPLPPVPSSGPNVGRIFRTIGSVGSTYLGHDYLKQFLKMQSEPPGRYDRDKLRRLERRMEEVKNVARDIVKPLMRNYLELDLTRDGGGLPYLTCTKVEQADLPWED